MVGTSNYIPHIGVLLESIWSNNKDLPIVYHLFLDSLPEIEKNRLCHASEQTHSEIVVHLMNNKAFASLVFGTKNESFFYRFVVADALNGWADRVLYLDGDIFCNGSLLELAECDLNENIAAVVRDRKWIRQKNQLGTEGFFNAGMMLIHIPQWCKESILEKVVDMSEDIRSKVNANGEYAEWHGLKYNDQNVLNKILDGKVLWLSRRYNYVYKLDQEALFRHKWSNADWKEQILLHFAGSVKPWHSWVSRYDVVKVYVDIWKQSPWNVVPATEPRTQKDFHQAARTARAEGRYSDMMKNYKEYFGKKLTGRK